ncbi:helix-turn-helix domain-containing protein [Rubrobacter aplysinae]|uniref:helix-turn-helix domain-containing protein n=1 Tax=Rubrobacter aplysinae TaxID=909625 RepID=UPI00069E722E|nr:helix-turn-helix domain-containing protein [Rubrobacter aplysinae]
MRGALSESKEILEVGEVAAYLGVGNVTVHRWCRDGRLPCFKAGRLWRIRRGALEEFMERGEQPETLAGRLRSFIEVPDNVLGIAQSVDLMHRLDAAFFKVGEARGGVLIKYHAGASGTGLERLKSSLERHGFEARRLEGEGRFRMLADVSKPGQRAEELQRLASEEPVDGRSVWAAFNWEERLSLDASLEQQRSLTRFVEGSSVVVKTSVLEEALGEWPDGGDRRAQLQHSGSIWLSEEGMSLSRTSPTPPD